MVRCHTLRLFLVSLEGGLGTVSHSQSILSWFRGRCGYSVPLLEYSWLILREVWVWCHILRVFLVSLEGGLDTVSHSQSILGWFRGRSGYSVPLLEYSWLV